MVLCICTNVQDYTLLYQIVPYFVKHTTLCLNCIIYDSLYDIMYYHALSDCLDYVTSCCIIIVTIIIMLALVIVIVCYNITSYDVMPY